MADIQTPQYLGIILAMVFSAFFSGVEMAFVSSNKLYFELKAKQNILSAKIIANFNQSPSQFIGTMLIGNTLSLVAYGIFMEEFLHHLILMNFPIITNEIIWENLIFTNNFPKIIINKWPLFYIVYLVI